MNRFIKWVLPSFVYLLTLLFGREAQANTINAASCSQTDVQAAINSANSGDTVVVPSCGATTWTSVSISGKNLTLQGQTTCIGTPASACIDNTNITTTGAGLQVTASATNFVTIAGFTFTVNSPDQNNGGIVLVASSATQGQVSFRFHHNHVITSSTSGAVGIVTVQYAYGLIDHTVFDDSGSGEHALGIQGDWAHAGFLAWNRPLSLGTNNAIYIEDSTFNLTNQTDGLVDGYTGGRIVFRHNNVIQNGSGAIGADNIGFHGTDSGSYRSFFSVEIYGNTFTNNSGGTMTSFRSRGGTALVYNNAWAGGSWNGITLQNYRADGSGNNSTWQNCNGTNWQLGSIDPTTTQGRTNSGNGGTYWLIANRDTTTNSVTTAFFDNNPGGSGGPGYACRDNVGRTYNQVLAPDYAWLNGSVTMGTYPPAVASYIVENQDYYNYKASFTGSSGVGSGLISTRPSACAAGPGGNTPGVGYWATDTNTLYVCNPTNTWTSYYTPYTYPHPLQGGAGPLPTPPSKLAAVVQ
jgi:hypothetical protein